MTDSANLTNLFLATERNAATTATNAIGNNNPTLSFGLTGVSDWGTSSPFIDIIKSARPWIGHEDGKWGGLTCIILKG